MPVRVPPQHKQIEHKGLSTPIQLRAYRALTFAMYALDKLVYQAQERFRKETPRDS
jgi:hypothetical protein